MRNRVFLFAKLRTDPFASDNLSTLMQKWFPVYVPTATTPNGMLDPVTYRPLNEYELNFFDLDFSFNTNVSVSHRFCSAHVKYHSIQYSRLGPKSSDYAIKFAENETNFSFAMISYVLQLEDILLVAAHELSIQNFILHNIKGLMVAALLRLKNKGVFCDFFFHVKLSEKLIFIPVEHIISKCVLLKQDRLNYIIAEFSSHTEHD